MTMEEQKEATDQATSIEKTKEYSTARDGMTGWQWTVFLAVVFFGALISGMPGSLI